jgi:hypothetical protein
VHLADHETRELEATLEWRGAGELAFVWRCQEVRARKL